MQPDKPAERYIGKWIHFFTPMMPKTPLFINPKGAFAVRIKAQRQFWIEPANPADKLDTTFTRIGEHIAIVSDTYDQYLLVRERLEKLQRNWKIEVENTERELGAVLGKSPKLTILSA